MIIKTIWLEQIDDIEAISAARPRILDPEVVPLGVASCPVVWLEDEIVFKFVDLDSSAQVSTF